ncbi:energy-coupling factor transport system ATP-binding protein [Alkalibacillus flavidus]|uniref:Energy-coupling factor transport system ATP-binding protein n=1 Tax=Alkalibacillus flavidus TaxID=546021 RepID=A0ABV2KWP0_9BACI
MIELEQVSFRYQNEASHVLENINLTIEHGEWVAIVGRNGSGKSTLAKLLNGLCLATSGVVRVNQTVLTDESKHQARHYIGMVFQNPENQFVGTTVADDVAFGLENLAVPRETMIKRIDQSLEQVDMTIYKDHEPSRLSGGQKQRVALASVLAMQPEVIVLDEATSMLDPIGKKQVLSLIQELQEQLGVTVIMVTHDLNEAALADRVITLDEGTVWFDGKPRELLEKGDQLHEVGLEPPFVTKVYQQLTRQSIDITQEPLHYEELVDELWRLYLKT